MKIEKLEPSQHRQGRWLVWLEDGSLVRVGEGEVVSLSLYTGKELTEAEGEALAAAARQNQMDRRAVALLTARPMSRRELMDKLSAPTRRRKPGREDEACSDPEQLEREREALRQAAEKTADWLEGLGLLNDEEYQDELYRRGVPREFWADALVQSESQAGQLDELVSKRMRGEEPTRENLKRTSDYLARRGFSWEEISAALERYRGEPGE